MKVHFFKPTAESISDLEKEMINTLVELRYEHYSPRLIRRIPEAGYHTIKTLVIKLGEKILKANHPDAEKYNEARIRFNSTINDLFKQDVKFIIVSFAAQLLQYYTLISSEKFEPEETTEEFVGFLTKTPQIGETDTNLLVAEYKLIKIYNDICDFVDAKTGVIAPIENMPARVEFLIVELKKIKSQIMKWLDDAPDNIFVHYLNFALNYCFAKVLELQFTNGKDLLADEEKSMLATMQHSFLEVAQHTLNQIQKLKERSVPFLYGVEFSLGQDIFNRLPETDLESIQSHVNSLLHS